MRAIRTTSHAIRFALLSAMALPVTTGGAHSQPATTLIAPGQTRTINAHGVCRRVTNTTDRSIAMPNGQLQDWAASRAGSVLFHEPEALHVTKCRPEPVAECNPRTFAGDWMAASYGVACELRAVSSGNIGGTCLIELYDETARSFHLEPVEVDGRFSIDQECRISGTWRTDRQRSMNIMGATWAEDGANPDAGVLMPANNTNISFF